MFSCCEKLSSFPNEPKRILKRGLGIIFMESRRVWELMSKNFLMKKKIVYNFKVFRSDNSIV